jgi:hypothetical protein
VSEGKAVAMTAGIKVIVAYLSGALKDHPEKDEVSQSTTYKQTEAQTAP